MGLLDGQALRFRANPFFVDADGDGFDDIDETGPRILFAEAAQEVVALLGPAVPGASEEAIWGPIADAVNPGADPTLRATERLFGDLYYFDVISNPGRDDTDFDDCLLAADLAACLDPGCQSDPDCPQGLPFSDTEELAFGSDPRANLTDDDNLDDASEAVWGTDPRIADTDGDGLDDFEETVAAQDNPRVGLNPTVPNEFLTFGDWSREYFRCFLIGETVEADSTPCLFGQIASGFTGPAADLRDFIGNLFRGEFVGAGFAAIGLVPLAGDVADAVRTAVRFAQRNPDKAVEMVAALSNTSEAVGGAPMRAIADDVAEELFGEARALLRANGVDNNSLDRLMRGGQNLDELRSVLRRFPNIDDVLGESTDFFNDWRDGERFLRDIDNGFFPTGKGFRDPSPTAASSARRYRIIDAYNPQTGEAFESKVGFQRLTPEIQRQIDRDEALLARAFDPDDPFSAYESLEWHFFPSGVSNTVGGTPELFDALEDAGIPYVIHLPAETAF